MPPRISWRTIAAHTNLDQSPVYSGSAVLAELLHLQNVRQEGFIFLGDVLEGETTADKLRQCIAQVEDEYIYLYGDASKPIRTLAICGGAFDEGYLQARQLGAQAYLTGEIRHHNAIAAVGSGFVLFGGGHFGTEAVLVPKLAGSLQNALNALQYYVYVYPSVYRPYGGRADIEGGTT